MGNGLNGIGIDVISGFVFHFCNLGSSFKTRIKMSILNNWGLRTGLILTLSVLATVGFWYGVSGAGWYWIAGGYVYFAGLLLHFLDTTFLSRGQSSFQYMSSLLFYIGVFGLVGVVGGLVYGRTFIGLVGLLIAGASLGFVAVVLMMIQKYGRK